MNETVVILVVAVLILVACLVAAIWDDIQTERNKKKDDPNA